MADNIDLSDLGGKPVDLSDLGGQPADQVASAAPVDLSGGAAGSGEGVLNDLGAGVVNQLPSKEEWQSFGSGAAQSGTLGFSDELGATKDVVQDLITGNPQAKKWREYQKSREAANKLDKEANPGAYLTGEITGGAATLPLMEFLGGAKLVSLAGKIGPKTAAFLASSTPEAMSIKAALEAGKIAPEAAEAALAAAPKAGLMTKIAGSGAKMAIEGAPLGAAMGFGGSEHDVNQPVELAKDVASSTGMASLGGLVIGGAVAGGKAALDYAPDLVKKWDFTRKTLKAYNMGKEGQNFDTAAGKSQVGQQLRDIPNDIADQIRAADKINGTAVEQSLDKAEAAGVKINVDPQLQAATNELFQTFAENPVLLQTVDPKSRALIMKLSKGGLGNMSPIEARALKDSLYDLSSKMNGLSSDVASISRGKSQEVGSALNDALKEQIPEYKDAAEKFANYRSQIAEPLLQPDLPADKRTKLLGDLKNKDTELYKGAKHVFGEAILPGAPALEKRNALNEVVGNLGNIEKNNPAAMKELGGSAEQVGNKWKDMADKMAVLKQSQGFYPNEGFTKTFMGSLVGAGEGMTYNMASRAGRVSSAVGQSKTVQIASKLFNGTDNQLMGLAQQLKKSNASAWYGEALEKALMNKNEAGKNAVLFKMLQIPEYRNMLRGDDDAK